MTKKDLIIQELDQLPESTLTESLETVRMLKTREISSSARPNVWQAYLDSGREREEVYQRLANS